MLTGYYSHHGYPGPLRRIRFKDAEGKTLVFLTNNAALPARTICELDRQRGQNSNMGVVSVYVLIATVKKCLNLHASLYQILQILSRTMFERAAQKRRTGEGNVMVCFGIDG